MRRRFPEISFGLLTGDCKDNPEADVLIMTTEILRNTLFNIKLRDSTTAPGKVPLAFEIDVDTELAGVIFDEVHYIADKDRGAVWEQALLMIPPHIPLLLLSATIHKPERFAHWVETRHGDTHGLDVYLLPTSRRIVPLTHYMWSGITDKTIDRIRDKAIQADARNLGKTPVLVKDARGTFAESACQKMGKVCSYLYNNYMSPKRKQVLNSLVSHLKSNGLLPALCFIFSRKQVEIAARDITISLHDDNGEMANTVEQECRKILMAKLPNYKEYLELPEYRNMVTLLQKGVAIHHAGILTVLREMVEILFDKGYIKLLFATETFAVGINMPTKTVIFTSLEKFDGMGLRHLLPHEYSQMAGRAGRRGIDTRGTVIHCNTLFEPPPISDYRHILTGPSQTITSSFRVSYHFVLNILLPAQLSKKDVVAFVANSLLNADIEKEIADIDSRGDQLRTTLETREGILEALKTPIEIATKYVDLGEELGRSVNKARKRITRERDSIESQYPSVQRDSQTLAQVQQLRRELESTDSERTSALRYIACRVDNITEFLTMAGFVRTSPNGTVSVIIPGIIASQIQEVNPLATALALSSSEAFRELNPCEISALLACLVPINLPEDKKTLHPNTSSVVLNSTTSELQSTLSKLQSLEARLEIDSGENYTMQLDIQQYVMDWYCATNESECRTVLQAVNARGISTGDFVKAVLKICNAVREIADSSEMLNYQLLGEKLAEIPGNLLKYVVTNQSLYL
jgi:superfamily II RNA helicase